MPITNPTSPTSSPPRTLHRTPTVTAMRAQLTAILALCDQGLLQPPATLTANGHRHVGETLAQARAVVERSRGGGG